MNVVASWESGLPGIRVGLLLREAEKGWDPRLTPDV